MDDFLPLLYRKAPLKKSRQSLKQMLAKVSRKNLHAEIESGAPVGREVW